MRFRALVRLTAAWALMVVVVGAWVRLTDAGLGCPDWPGCYGHLVGVPDTAHEHAAAEQAFPGLAVDTGKAWREMIHRYIAGALGLLILVITVLAWRRRRAAGQSPVLPTALLLLVVLQALLGMWTVTLLLKPVIVTLHLLGGMTTLALLVWLALRQSEGPPPHRSQGAAALRPWALLGLLVLFAQIALGGWVSTNYAALACPDFPLCRGAWYPEMNFRDALHLVRELGMTAAGELLSQEALTAIHWLHRVGALVTLLYLGVVAIQSTAHPAARGAATFMLAALLVQVALGISNVLFSLPLPLAVAHNAGAAVLLAATVMLNFRLSRS